MHLAFHVIHNAGWELPGEAAMPFGRWGETDILKLSQIMPRLSLICKGEDVA